MWSRALIALIFLIGTAVPSSAVLIRAGGAPGGGGPATNVISVALSNENVAPSAATGTPIATVSAKVTGGGNCNTCTWTMQTTGIPTGQPGPSCTTASNNFQLVSLGGGQAQLQVLNNALTPQTFGAPPAPNNFVCVKATPASGTSYLFAFSIMVRGNVFTSVTPLTVNYTNPTSSGTHIATMSATVHGTAGTQTVTLGADTMCGNLTVSGQDLVAGTTLTTQRGICHVTVAQTGVTCPILGYTVATPATCIVPVMIEPSPYIGPGDATYANGATGLAWTRFNEPYCFNALYASPGNNPVWTVIRERDQAYFTANCLTNGDMDIAGLAAFCDTSICYEADNPTGSNGLVDQSGNSPANDLHAWADNPGQGNPLTIWRPVITWNAVNGVMPALSNSNATDRFNRNNSTYNGSGSTGTVETVAESNGATALAAQLLNWDAVNTGSTDETILQYSKVPGGDACLYNGPDNASGVLVCSSGTAPTGAFHGVIGVVNGTTTNGTQVIVDGGTAATGTFTTNPSLIKPNGQGGGFGGGSLTGYMTGSAVSPNGSPASNQLAALYCFQYQHFGVGAGTGC